MQLPIISSCLLDQIALCFLQNFTYPDGVGLPIGGEDEVHTHLMLEIHYDNPDELSGM